MKFLHLFKVKPLLVLALFAISFQLIGQSVPAELRATQDERRVDVKPTTNTKPSTANADKIFCTPDTGGTPESGSACMSTQTVDVNGGGNFAGCPLETIAVGQTISGHVNTFDRNTRDTDWFEFYLDGTQAAEVTVCANFLYAFFELFAPCGNPTVGQTVLNLANESGTITFGDCTTPPPAGYYYFFISSQTFSGIPCGTAAEYSVSVADLCGAPSCTTLTGDNLNSSIPVIGTGGDCSNAQTSTAPMGATGTIGTDWEISSVDLDLTHTFDLDLIIDLMAPDGTTLNLSDGNGGSDDNYTSTVFMDGGASIVGGSGTNAPFTGTFEPQGGTFAGAFAGTSVMGDWRLVICDQFNGDDGTLNNFQITFCPLAPPACVTSDEAPMIDTPCPGTITLCGAQNVSWTEPTATDNCDMPSVSNNYDPGNYFGVGTHTVTYTFTDLAGLTASCSFDVVINPLPEIAISTSNLPAFCQGVQSLSVRVMNEEDLAGPLSYSWSHGLGNDSEAIAGQNDTNYSLTVTDGNGCSSTASYYLSVDLSNLLSAHVIVADDQLEMSESDVYGGGVGLMDADEDVKVINNSIIHTFMESEEVYIDGSSSIADYIDGPSTLGLPAFSANPYNDVNDITVAAGSSMTLSGTNYGKITVMNNASLTFDNPSVFVKKMTTKSGATIMFNQATNVMIKQSLSIGSDNAVNPYGLDVVLYIGDGVNVKQGSYVMVDMYAQEGIQVNESDDRSRTYMIGLFITHDGVESGDQVVWDWNFGCGPAPVYDGEELAGAINTDNVAQTPANKGIVVYPNPSKGQFTLNINDFMDRTIDITIYNAIGKVVWAQHIDKVEVSSLNMDLSNAQFSNGIYHIGLRSGDEIQTKSLVLNK